MVVVGPRVSKFELFALKRCLEKQRNGRGHLSIEVSEEIKKFNSHIDCNKMSKCSKALWELALERKYWKIQTG